MNDKTSGSQGPRYAGALAVMAAVTMLTAACGAVHVHIGSSGGSAPSSASTPAYAQELALAQCMRGHGEPNFPDPTTSGGYTLTSNGSIEGAGGSSVNINSSQAQAAYGDCRHLVSGSPSISQLEQAVQQGQQRQAQDLPELLKWEQCVRGHGEPNFPDVIPGGQSTPPPAKGAAAFNPNSPQAQAALSACQHLLPPGASINISSSRSPHTS
jgi:hypothetical protein